MDLELANFLDGFSILVNALPNHNRSEILRRFWTRAYSILSKNRGRLAFESLHLLVIKAESNHGFRPYSRQASKQSRSQKASITLDSSERQSPQSTLTAPNKPYTFSQPSSHTCEDVLNGDNRHPDRMDHDSPNHDDEDLDDDDFSSCEASRSTAPTSDSSEVESSESESESSPSEDCSLVTNDDVSISVHSETRTDDSDISLSAFVSSLRQDCPLPPISLTELLESWQTAREDPLSYLKTLADIGGVNQAIVRAFLFTYYAIVFERDKKDWRSKELFAKAYNIDAIHMRVGQRIRELEEIVPGTGALAAQQYTRLRNCLTGSLAKLAKTLQGDPSLQPKIQYFESFMTSVRTCVQWISESQWQSKPRDRMDSHIVDNTSTSDQYQYQYQPDTANAYASHLAVDIGTSPMSPLSNLMYFDCAALDAGHIGKRMMWRGSPDVGHLIRGTSDFGSANIVSSHLAVSNHPSTSLLTGSANTHRAGNAQYCLTQPQDDVSGQQYLYRCDDVFDYPIETTRQVAGRQSYPNMQTDANMYWNSNEETMNFMPPYPALAQSLTCDPSNLRLDVGIPSSLPSQVTISLPRSESSVFELDSCYGSTLISAYTSDCNDQVHQSIQHFDCEGMSSGHVMKDHHYISNTTLQ